MASCSDDTGPACAPQSTRICAGVGRCQGVEVCQPDGTGYGECDCSGPPREGAGGTSGDEAQEPYVGRSCAADADCGTGLTCITSSSNDFLGGGPANGYCTRPCTADAECSSVDRQSQCVVPAEGVSGMCMRTCLSLDPRSLTENKCLGRVDLVCQSEAYLGLAMVSGLRQDGWCYPQCGSDEDCPGRACDLARGLCVDSVTAGLPIGAACTANADCSGRLCVGLALGQAFCSAPCVFGQPIGCGYGLSGNPRRAGCIAPRVRGFLSAEGIGDVGFCAELCSADADCTQAASNGWVCDETVDAVELFNREGVCDVPAPVDGGADGGNGGSSPANDASVDPPISVGDAG